MNSIEILVQSVPDAVWAVFLGSALTLAGVFLTNRHNRIVQAARLEHESREREKQRKFEARSEVFLAAAAEMAKAQQVLGSLANVDFAKGNPAEFLAGFISASNQAVLIASDETAEVINDFLSAFLSAFFRLSPKMISLGDAKIERDIQDSSYRAYQSEVNRIQATMTYVVETGSYSTVDWNALNENLQFNQERMREAADLRSRAWEEINRLNFQFLDDLADQIQEISRANLPALVAMRSDLEIPTDITRYRAHMEKRLIAMNEHIEKFKTAVRDAAGVQASENA